MIGFVLVVGFPIIEGLGYGLTYYASGRFAPSHTRNLLARWGGAIYVVLLLVPLVGVLRFISQEKMFASPRQFGIALPTLSFFPVWLTATLCILLAIFLGRLLFLQELILSAQLRRLLGGNQGSLNAALEGQSSELVREVPPLILYMATSTPIVFMEEFLWRGFLIYFLVRYLHVPILAALPLAALSFGLNHANFGIRNVILKTMDGLAWGILLVSTSSLLIPVLSHLTFQYFVWRRLDRQAGGLR